MYGGQTSGRESKPAVCNVCAVTAPAPAAKLSSLPLPDEPWDRIHVDFAGPFLGNMWMLVMGAYSKWPSVVRMSNYSTTETTTMTLNILFTTWGCPKAIVSDNGPLFASNQFEDWCRLNGIVHLTSAPFHPLSNGKPAELRSDDKCELRSRDLFYSHPYITTRCRRCTPLRSQSGTTSSFGATVVIKK